MAFAPPFPRVFHATFDRRAAAAVAPAWWVVAGKTCVAAYQPKGAASLAASYTNLAQPGTYDAAPGTAPTWASATGWTFNGTQYLTTGVVPTGVETVLCRFSDAQNFATEICMFGSQAGSSAIFTIEPSYNNKVRYRFGGGGGGVGEHPDVAPGLTAGVLGMSGRKAFRNGADEGVSLMAWSGTGISTYIGALHFGAGAVLHWPGNIQALAIYSDTLTAGEVATVSAAMAAL